MHQTDARQAKRVLLIQIALTLILSLSGSAFSNLIAVSAFIGAAACTLANGVLALGVYGRYRAAEPGSMVMRFYAAEIAKIVVILVLFSAAFVLVDGLNLPVLLGAYFLVQVLPVLMASQWDAPDKNVRK